MQADMGSEDKAHGLMNLNMESPDHTCACTLYTSIPQDSDHVTQERHLLMPRLFAILAAISVTNRGRLPAFPGFMFSSTA